MRRLRSLCLALLLLVFGACARLPPVAPLAQLAPGVPHPLDPLSASELQTAFDTVLAHFRADASLPKEPLRFPMLVLAEPDKQFVLSWQTGQAFPRHASAHIMHHPSNRLWVAEIDLTSRRVLQLEEKPRGTQAALTGGEFEASDALVRAYEPWQRALRERGVDPAQAYLDGWAAGDAPLAGEIVSALSFGKDTRLMRVLTFHGGPAVAKGARTPPQNPYVRPVEGLVVTVDLNAMRVVHMTDAAVQTVSSETGNAAPSQQLRRLLVTQPEGSDLKLQGQLVRWHSWQFRVVMHPREGLVLYDVRFDDHGVLRPVAYRLALSEIYVPYGLPEPNWAWRGALDVGEYNAGKLAQSLALDRDVPDNALLLDAVLFSDRGPSPSHPTGSLQLPDVIALYERDAGVLWSRSDPNGRRDTRMSRELVATWNCLVGNYVYGFDWIFKLDGSIEVSVKLTGTTLNRGTDARPEPAAPKVGQDRDGRLVAAPNHQHFLSFRLDLDIDGPSNQVMEMEVQHLPHPAFDNGFDALTSHVEVEGFRDVNPFTARHWHIESGGHVNQLGKPTGYALEPAAFAIPYASAELVSLARAQFALHQLWLTRYRPDELYAAGAFPNQGKGHDGVASFIAPAEPIHGQDLVVWYTTGFTHLAKPEDHPVMSAESIGFRLAPRGFFARNPALEVSDQAP